MLKRKNKLIKRLLNRKGEKMTKKILSIFLLVAMMGTVLCGCGGGSTEEQTGNDGNNATTGELVHGGEITVGIAQDLEDSLDPHKTVEAGTKEPVADDTPATEGGEAVAENA